MNYVHRKKTWNKISRASYFRKKIMSKVLENFEVKLWKDFFSINKVFSCFFR